MKQVFLVHGGGTFATHERFLAYLKTAEVTLEASDHHDWKRNLAEDLGPDYTVARPQMPNKENAQYDEWKLWFERCIPLLQKDIILVGHSLGGMFLAKYLSENDLPLAPTATLLVSAPFDGTEANNLIQFVLPSSLERFAAQGGNIFLYFSKDDPVVPFDDLAKYQTALPNATSRIFEDRKHFNMPEFPELIADIKAL